MEQEPRHLTDQELESSIQNQLTLAKQNKIIEESNNLELKKKFNLTYVSYDDYSISIESENFSGYRTKYSDPVIKMLCKLDIKDISTFEEFQEARDIVLVEKKITSEALDYITKLVFKPEVESETCENEG